MNALVIEFECPVCLAVLRTADRHSARSITCPACTSRVVVPTAPGAEPAGAPDVELDTDIVVCPVCGTRNLPEDPTCRNCDESLRTPASADVVLDEPTPPFAAQDVVAASWNVYRREFGPSLLGYVLCTLVWFIGLLAGAVLIGMVMLMVRRGPLDRPFLIVMPLVLTLLLFVTTYSQIGQMLFYEHIVREQRSDMSLLFQGGRFLLRLMLLRIVQTLVIGMGLIAFVVPGVIAYAVFWPASFILVDRDCGVFEALDRARRMTTGHRLTLTVVSAVDLAIRGVGLAGFVLFSLVTSPLADLLCCETYVRLRGEDPEPEPRDGRLIRIGPTESEDTVANDVLEPWDRP